MADYQQQFMMKKIDAVRDFIEVDRLLIAEIIANILDISVDSARRILSEKPSLNKHFARGILKRSCPDQQETRAD